MFKNKSLLPRSTSLTSISDVMKTMYEVDFVIVQYFHLSQQPLLT